MPHDVASDQGPHRLLSGFSIRNRIQETIPRKLGFPTAASVTDQMSVKLAASCQLPFTHSIGNWQMAANFTL